MKPVSPTLKTAEDCIAFAQKANPKKEHLTIEKLKSYPGCEHYTDEQATSIIQTLEQLAFIVYALTSQARNNTNNQNTSEVIIMNNSPTKNMAA